ncbi:adenine glycosylase [Xiamenia xianingshaonis]|uniref:Adenine glycosylase n=1 Tax=Xiamenia xianingshaonis TaxID=2682776 RepID=A0A9E6MRS4_9ACTN|nr:adenine glycosylase [Xiamenia xianingshaonis]NHM14366.1 adenine glycosylase [Xiamenia xianingshaonis]QTU84845.1 adenine glycosylase [Xiamenia xianingshaonis]
MVEDFESAQDGASGAWVAAFRDKVRTLGGALYRDLPWRCIDDPYGVLVSEVMLQQTQVKRVLGRWEAFMALFPTIDALAAADVSAVLSQWQGLGYNRRALALKRTAETCADRFAGRLPESYDELVRLPGIGPATAAGVRAFAFDQPGVYLETNVRTVFLYELFSDRDGVADKELVPLVQAACPQTDVRGWYYALLDYGAHLKATVGNHARRSATYARQSAFEGSRRQKRAEVVRIVLSEPGIELESLAAALDREEAGAGRSAVDRDVFESIVADLVREGFFRQVGDGFVA